VPAKQTNKLEEKEEVKPGGAEEKLNQQKRNQAEELLTI
jgi:hypothetical protein